MTGVEAQSAFDPRIYAHTRVVVLGASGFIGRWVARALSSSGARAVLVVRSERKTGPMLEAMGVAGELIEADLGEAGRAARLLERTRPAIIFNLVGYGVDPSERDPEAAERLNLRLAAEVARAAAVVADRTWPGQHLVNVGSALEYGRAKGNLAEDTTPQPMESYGRTKLAGTMAVSEACAAGRLAAVTARLFTVYGAGEHRGRLLPSLLDTARSGRPLDLTAGLQGRDFTYVEDVAEGLLRLGAASPQQGTVVNLCTGRLETVRSFVQTAARVLSIPPELLRFGARPGRQAEMDHDDVAIDRLLRLTGWRPTTAPSEGIAATAALEAAAGRWPSQ